MRVGRRCSIEQRGVRLYSGGVQTRGVREGSHSVTGRDTAGEAAPEVRAVKSSEFGQGNKSAP